LLYRFFLSWLQSRRHARPKAPHHISSHHTRYALMNWLWRHLAWSRFLRAAVCSRIGMQAAWAVSLAEKQNLVPHLCTVTYLYKNHESPLWTIWPQMTDSALDASCVTRDALCLREPEHERGSIQASTGAGREIAKKYIYVLLYVVLENIQSASIESGDFRRCWCAKPLCRPRTSQYCTYNIFSWIYLYMDKWNYSTYNTTTSLLLYVVRGMLIFRWVRVVFFR
jgi:hypothetical protein